MIEESVVYCFDRNERVAFDFSVNEMKKLLCYLIENQRMFQPPYPYLRANLTFSLFASDLQQRKTSR